MEELKQKKIGLALGGGAALGMAHIGVAKALDEFDLKVSCLSGTSVGALISAFMAFGKSWEDMYTIAKDLKWLDITDFTFSKLGLFSNKKIESLLKKHLDGAMFEDALTPFAVITTDISTGERVVINSGSVSQAVMASTCVPGVFVPVEREGRMLVDGAIAENVPISPLHSLGADFEIGVDLSSRRKPKYPSNIIEVLLLTFHHAILKNVQSSTIHSDLTISPDLSGFGFTGLDRCDDLVEVGYLETKKVLEAYLSK